MYVYADNAATTKMSPTAKAAMLPFLDEIYGNPSSLHSIGQRAAEELVLARQSVAECIGADAKEITFTGGGSEADNQALLTAAQIGRQKGKMHIVSSKFEHHAILHTLDALKKQGFSVTLVDVHTDGLVRPEEVAAAIGPDTCLVSIMYANNEIGTIQPIAEIGKICHDKGVLFHTDAVQAITHVPIDVHAQNIDMLSMAGHKFHGPKGVGALYCRKGIFLTPLIYGGAQERGKRAGTENLGAIVGMAAALKEGCAHLTENAAYVGRLRDKLMNALTQIPHSVINGSVTKRLPGNLNMCFEGIEGESLLLMLDMHGIAASSGSACTSGSLAPSHVLLSIGRPAEIAHGSLRLTLCESNTEEEIDHIIEWVPQVVDYLRNMSPVWDELEKGEKKHVI